MCADYSHPLHASMKFPGKKGLNQRFFGRIRNPQAADLCQLHMKAMSTFPGQSIAACRMDVANAYNRIRVRTRDVPLGGLLFRAGNNVDYVAMPIVEWWGSQDSNFHFAMLTEDMSQRSTARCLQAYGAAISGMYTDDFFTFAPDHIVDSECDLFVDDIEHAVGHPAVKPSKTIRGSVLDIIGIRNDCVLHTIGLSATMYLKVVCAFFVTLPMDITINTRLPIHILQRLSSYAIRCADVMSVMLPYSRGFASCLCGTTIRSVDAPLNARAYEDMWLWRVVLHLSFNDTRWMNIPIHIPLLHRYLKGEDDVTRAHRQASLARIVLYADACTDHNHGLGYYIPLCGWNSLDIPTLCQYYANDDLLHDVDINILEFIAVIIALCAAIRMLHVDPTYDKTSYTHIHVWTDNQSCKSWMLKHKANQPLHSFLLQLFVLLQIQNRIVVTVGHYLGSINVYADAASRKFCVPQGEQYQR